VIASSAGIGEAQAQLLAGELAVEADGHEAVLEWPPLEVDEAVGEED